MRKLLVPYTIKRNGGYYLNLRWNNQFIRQSLATKDPMEAFQKVNQLAPRIMRLSEVKAVTGLSKTTIYRFEKEGRFPSRVSLGERSVGWFEDDVEAFLLSLKQSQESVA